MSEYDAVFWRELEAYVADAGLVPSADAPGVQRCPAQYFPTHPGVSPTKAYEFGLRVHLNGPSLTGGPYLMRERDGLTGTEGIPSVEELDVDLMRAGGAWQNQARSYSTHQTSDFCSWPQRGARLSSTARAVPTTCESVAAYTGYLMRDTYTDLEGYRFRGYWIVPPLIDPNNVNLINEANANAYGNSLGRSIHYESRYEQSAGDTRAVDCDEFDYIMPLAGTDADYIEKEIARAERTHQRTGPGNYLFVRN